MTDKIYAGTIKKNAYLIFSKGNGLCQVKVFSLFKHTYIHIVL